MFSPEGHRSVWWRTTAVHFIMVMCCFWLYLGGTRTAASTEYLKLRTVKLVHTSWNLARNLGLCF